MKGWTQDEAEHQARLWRMMYPHSELQHRVGFDAQWAEWVVITDAPDCVNTVSRKPRRGLRETFRPESQS